MKNKLIKLLIIILIIFIILCFIWGVLAIYKIIIFNKIFDSMKNKVSLNNYYMKMISQNDSSGNIEIFYKNGVGKLVTSDGSYTWTNGEEAYLVVESEKKYYKLSKEDLGLMSEEAVASMLPGYSKNPFERMILAGKLTTSVKTEKVVGLKYYKIKTVEENQEKIIWLNKETLIPSEAKVKIGEEVVAFRYEISFDSVKNEKVSKPNLEGYTLIENLENN